MDIAAVTAVMWSGLAVIVFVTLVAVWALLSGRLLVPASSKVDADHGRWWMPLGAVVSILYGVALIVAPLVGALVLTC